MMIGDIEEIAKIISRSTVGWWVRKATGCKNPNSLWKELAKELFVYFNVKAQISKFTLKDDNGVEL
jgi:hypothetical protein